MHGQMPKLTHMRPFLQGLGLFEGEVCYRGGQAITLE